MTPASTGTPLLRLRDLRREFPAGDETIAVLRDVNARLGVTIVIVSHELQALGSLCQRAAVVEDGRIAELFDLRDHREPRKTSLGRELLYHATEAHATEAHAAAVHAGLPPGELHA